MSDTRPALATMISALTPLVIGALGLYFTHTYKESEKKANDINEARLALENEQRILIDKANVIKDYFAYLADKSDENQQRAALTVLGTLGYTDLVIKVVTADPTESNLQALAAIATTASSSDAANTAFGALESIVRSKPTETAAAAADAALSTAQSTQVPDGKDTVVVAGADRTFEAAQTEVKNLQARGFQDVQVVKRGDWYRTVVPVSPESSASETLNRIRTEVRPGAYAVDMKRWCDPKAQSTCETAQP